MENFYNFLVNPIISLLGWGIVGLIVVLILGNVKKEINNKIYIRRERRKIAKRFDKPPMAKCYCYSCNYWKPRSDASQTDVNEGRCTVLNLYTSDYEFCSRGLNLRDKTILERKHREEQE